MQALSPRPPADIPPPITHLTSEPLPRQVLIPLPPPPPPPPISPDSDFPISPPILPPPPPDSSLVPLPTPLQTSIPLPTRTPPPPAPELSSTQASFLWDRPSCLRSVLDALSATRTSPHERLSRLTELLEISEISRDVPGTSCVSAGEVVRVVRSYLAGRVRAIRVAALRALSGLNKTKEFSVELERGGVGFFVARSLERDRWSRDQAGVERQEALRFVRAFLAVNPVCLPISIVTALCAVVRAPEPSDSSFPSACLEVLCETAVLAPQLLQRCHGMKVIFDSVLHPAYSSRMMETLVATILFLLDDETTRRHLQADRELLTLLSPLVAVVKQTPPVSGVSKSLAVQQGLGGAAATRQADQLRQDVDVWLRQCKAALRFVELATQTWTGAIALSCDNILSGTLVTALRLPQPEVRRLIVNTIFTLVRAPHPQDKADPFGNHGSHASPHTQISEVVSRTMTSMEMPPSLVRRHNVLDNQIVVVLLGLINAGIIDALAEIARGPPCDDEPAADRASEKLVSLASGPPEPARSQDACFTLPLRKKAVVLLGEIFFLTNKLLHPSQCVRLQLMPSLVDAATSSNRLEQRSRASSVLGNLHSYSKLRAESDVDIQRRVVGRADWSAHVHRDYRLERISEVKLQLDRCVSEAALNEKIADTKVTAHKDWQKWEWDSLLELMEGALANPANTDFALRNASSFYRRLLGFYKPKEKLFSKLDWSQSNLRYVHVGWLMLDNLLSTPGGTQLVVDEKFFSQLCDAFRQELDAEEEKKLQQRGSGLVSPSFFLTCQPSPLGTAALVSSASASSNRNSLPAFLSPPSSTSHSLSSRDSMSLMQQAAPPPPASSSQKASLRSENAERYGPRLFCQESLVSSLAREYITLIGHLTSTQSGLEFLSQFAILPTFLRLIEESTRDDLSYAILKGLDYKHKETRGILVAFANSKSRVMRLTAVRYMRVLLRLSVEHFERWGVELLVRQLDDDDRRVGVEALSVLTEACEVHPVAALDTAIKGLGSGCEEKLMRYEDKGASLLLKFLSRPTGLELLCAGPFVQRELNKWVDQGFVVEYVRQLDAHMAAHWASTADGKRKQQCQGAVAPSPHSTTASAGAVMECEGVYFQPHLFGELANTEKGREMITSGNYVRLFLSKATDPAASTLEQRAALISLGHIGITTPGFGLLEKCRAPSVIRKLAETSPSLSLRGAAFAALGMLCSSPQGRTCLAQAGWLSPLGGPRAPQHVCVAVPAQPAKNPFFKLPAVTCCSTFSAVCYPEPGLERFGDERDEIVHNVEALFTVMSAQVSAPALSLYHKQNPKAFHSPQLLLRLLHFLQAYQLDRSVRKFVYALTLDSLPSSGTCVQALFQTLDTHVSSASPPPQKSPSTTTPPPALTPRTIRAFSVPRTSS